MKIDFSKWIDALHQGVALIDKLKPIAALGGPQVAAVVGVVTHIGDLADQALAHAQDAANIVSAQDLATVRAIQKQVQDEGDRLAALVDAS